jgi:hypothetical protein
VRRCQSASTVLEATTIGAITGLHCERIVTGILFFGIWCVWFAISLVVSIWFGKRFKNFFVKAAACLALLAVLLPLPVADEIVADRQLEALCREGAVMKLDEAKIKGRSVRYSAEPLNEDVIGIAIPVTFTRGVLRDANTSEMLGSSSWYAAKGGVLVRAMGFSESNSPMFARSGCAPGEGEHEAAKRIGFTIIN